jgi:hypothetical protein
MSEILTATYEGDGVLRLLDKATGLRLDERVQVWVLPFAPPKLSPVSRELSLEERIQAVYDDMGSVEIQDSELARQIAEDDSLLEWNLPL